MCPAEGPPPEGDGENCPNHSYAPIAWLLSSNANKTMKFSDALEAAVRLKLSGRGRSKEAQPSANLVSNALEALGSWKSLIMTPPLPWGLQRCSEAWHQSPSLVTSQGKLGMHKAVWLVPSRHKCLPWLEQGSWNFLFLVSNGHLIFNMKFLSTNGWGSILSFVT